MDLTQPQNDVVARAVLSLMLRETAGELREWVQLQSELGTTEIPATPVREPDYPPVMSSSSIGPHPVSAPCPPSPDMARPVPAQRHSSFDIFSTMNQDVRPADAGNENRAERKERFDQDMRSCRQCSLCSRRTGMLCGYGPLDASIMFIGAGGNPRELEAQRIMTGEAAELLDNIIAAMAAIQPDAAKDRIYYTNAIKCPVIPAGNQKKQAMKACCMNLHREVEIIRPKVIIAWGQTAYTTMFDDLTNIMSVRGIVRNFEQIPTVPTHHPLEMLKNKQLKALVWKDVRTALHLLNP